MPYHLRITQEEVRKELDLLGFTEVAEETVGILHKDLLKLIKSDLLKIKQKRKNVRDPIENIDYGDPCVTPHTHHTHLKNFPKLQKKSTPFPSGPHTALMQKSSIRSLDSSTLQTSKNEGKGDEESGYSDSSSMDLATSESYDERNEGTSASYTSSDYAIKAKLPKDNIKAISNESKKQKHKIRDTTHNDSDTESEEVSSVSYKRSAANQFQDPSGRRKMEQVLRKQKVSKASKGKDTLPAYPNCPDPVTLYHYYKAHWDKFKVPGEDPRLKLRWDVRTRLFYSK